MAKRSASCSGENIGGWRFTRDDFPFSAALTYLNADSLCKQRKLGDQPPSPKTTKGAQNIGWA
jgi:hypothetical protein